MASPPRKHFGIDGCKGGWIVAQYCKRTLLFSFFPSIAAFYEDSLNLGLSSTIDEETWALIDIPIGLPERGERVCDIEGRALLESRRSTLFPVPVRSAVYAKTFAECGIRNLEGQAKKVSIQFWNIAPKVIEVDQFLQNNPQMIGRLCEAHPELAFRRLAGAVIALSKHTADGRNKRVQILRENSDENFELSLRNFVQRHKTVCTEGDLLDAASLAVLCSRRSIARDFVGDGAVDSYNLPMTIAT